MAIYAIFLSLFIGSFAHSQTSTGEYVGFSQSQFELWTGFSYLSTTANFDAGGGTFSILPSGRYYKRYLFEFGGRFDVTDSVAFGASMGYAQAESNDAFFIKVHGNLTNVTPFFETRLIDGWVDLIGRLAVVVPLEKVTNANDSPLVDEGVIQIKGELQLQKDFDPIFVTLMSGYHSLNDRSSRIPYAAYAGVELGHHVLAAGIKGFQSIKNDPETNTPSARSSMISTANAGSTILSSVNPSVSILESYYRFRSDGPWNLKISGEYSANGENYAQYWSAGLQFGYIIDFEKPKARYNPKFIPEDEVEPVEDPFVPEPTRKRTPPPATLPPPSAPTKRDSPPPGANGFKVEGDGVDQTLFTPRQNLDDPYVEREMKQQKDDSGFAIELQPKKKKKKRRK